MLLKVLSKVGADFILTERLFHNFAPRKENPFCPFAELFIGIWRSVAVLRSSYAELVEFRMNSSWRYCGASPFTDLNTMTCDSYSIIFSIVLQPCCLIRLLLGASCLLQVIILAARFCNFCKWLISDAPATPLPDNNRKSVDQWCCYKDTSMHRLVKIACNT